MSVRVSGRRHVTECGGRCGARPRRRRTEVPFHQQGHLTHTTNVPVLLNVTSSDPQQPCKIARELCAEFVHGSQILCQHYFPSCTFLGDRTWPLSAPHHIPLEIFCHRSHTLSMRVTY